MQNPCAILSSVACPGVQCFSTLSHKWHGFREIFVISYESRSLVHISARDWVDPRAAVCRLMDYVSWIFSRTLPWIKPKTFRLVEQCLKQLHSARPIFTSALQLVSYVNQTRIFWTDFRKILENRLSSKCVQWEPSCSVRTDMKEYNNNFSQFCERA